ncbi:MAG: FkbM family methyltransferase [Marivita sp.]|uniref:FkbM family methyltransferase n=1 Tax=Marivita sp. TaxID=2003365 RepID=UPI003EF5BB70
MERPNIIRLRTLHDLLSPERLTEIVDVGANPVNAPDYEDMFASGLVRVTGFEPQEEAYLELAAQENDRARFFPYAVGDGGTHDLRVCKSSGFTSLLEPRVKTYDFLGRFHKQGRVLERVPVPTRRLDDISEIAEVDFLKIDIQGGEVDVFENARETLKSCVAIMTEVAFVPLYEDQPLLDAQMAVLRGQGFHLHKFMFAKSMPMPSSLKVKLRRQTSRNQLIDGDAVFIRDLLDLETVSDERLKHLALLADGCFGSFDLVVRCLSHLVDRGTVTEADCQAYFAHLDTA